MFTIYPDLLLMSVSLIINFINIKSYYLNIILQHCILILISILSYICTFGYKLTFAFLRKKDLKIAFINKINESFMISTNLKTHKTVEESVTSYKIERILKKVV